MDGYAVRAADATASASLRLVGTSAAGHGFSGTIGPGETVRIFTGAPVPEGADGILIQENAQADGETIRALEEVTPQTFIRRAGMDFSEGDALLAAGDTLDARRHALAAGEPYGIWGGLSESERSAAAGGRRTNIGIGDIVVR